MTEQKAQSPYAMAQAIVELFLTEANYGKIVAYLEDEGVESYPDRIMTTDMMSSSACPHARAYARVMDADNTGGHQCSAVGFLTQALTKAVVGYVSDQHPDLKGGAAVDKQRAILKGVLNMLEDSHIFLNAWLRNCVEDEELTYIPWDAATLHVKVALNGQSVGVPLQGFFPAFREEVNEYWMSICLVEDSAVAV